MADAFISYSRADARFVRKLASELEKRGFNLWVDVEDVPPMAEWLKEITEAIEGADYFLFVISPDSVKSEICGLEIRHAVEHEKRMAPLLFRPVAGEKVSSEITELQWISFEREEDFPRAIDELAAALRTDLEAVRRHTRLLTRATQWRDKDRDRNLLLRGGELRAAEEWASDEGHSPAATTLQREFVGESRRAAGRRERRGWTVAVVVLLTVVTLSGFYLQQRRLAADRERIGLSRQVAARALEQEDGAWDLAVLLCVEAYTIHPTIESLSALQRLLLRRPRVYRLLHDVPEPVTGLRFANDGRRLAAGLEDGSIRIWDAGTGEVLTDLKPAQEGHVGAFAFSSSLDRAAAAGGSLKVVRRLALPEGRPVEPLQIAAGANILSLQYSSDDNLLAAGNGLRGLGITVWPARDSTAAGRTLTEFEAGISTVRFSANGLLAASGWDSRIAIHEPVDSAVSKYVDTGSSAALEALAFSPDGRHLAASGDDGAILVFVLESDDTRVTTLSSGGANARSLAFGPRGVWLAAGFAEGRVSAWKWEGEKPREETLRGLWTYVDRLAFDAKGQLLAGGGYDPTIAIWRMDSVNRLGTLIGRHAERVTALAFSPSGRWIASSGWDRLIKIWDLESDGRLVATLPGHPADVYVLGFASDPVTLLSLDSQLLPSGQGRANFIRWALDSDPPSPITPLPQPVQAAGIAGMIQGLPSLRAETYPVAASPTGGTIARAENRPDPATPRGVRPVVVFIDTTTPGSPPAILVTDHEHSIQGLAFSPDDRFLATAGADGRGELWDLTAKSRVGVFGAEEGGAGQAVAISRDKTVAIGSGTGITLFPEGRPNRRVRLPGRPASVQCLAFDPMGKTLVSGHRDGQFVVWDVAAGQAIGDAITVGVARSTFPMSPRQSEIIGLAGEGVLSLAFSPDGKSLLTGDSEGCVVHWDLDIDHWIAIACRAVNRDLTRSERRNFLTPNSE